MADISKIKIPNNTEYNVKDAALTAEITNARGSYVNLDARLDNYDEVIGDIDEALNSLLVDLVPKTITENGTYDPTDDNVDGYSEVTVDVATGGHKVVITTVANALVTLSKTGTTYTATADSNGIASFIGVASGTYTATATIDDAVSDSLSITVSDYLGIVNTFATITLSAKSACTITLTNGTITKTINYVDTAIPVRVSLGTWTASTTIESTPISIKQVVSSYIDYPIVFEEWAKFRALVRAGTAPTQYPVGTLLYDTWGDNTSTAYRIVSYDQYFDSDLTARGYTHSVTLLEEYLDEDIVFDAPEAFLYLTQDLPVGTYYIEYSSSTICRFTTTVLVPSGGQLSFKVVNPGDSASTSYVQGYSSPSSTTPLFEVSTSTSSSGTNLGTMANNTTTNVTYGTLNAYNRAIYGSNNYYESGIRQLINATIETNWWTPQTVFDRPTNISMSGKLYRLNSDFINVLASPNLTSIANAIGETNALDGTTFTKSVTYNIKDKLFLPAPSELNINSQDADKRVGTLMSYYSGAGNSQRIKYKKSATSTAYDYWLRTPRPPRTYHVRGIYTNGSLEDISAYYAIGSATACVIQ